MRTRKLHRRPGAGRANGAEIAIADDPALPSPWVQLRSASTHPFIYSRMVQRADHAARGGDVANVYDRRGAFFGRGLYNPRSRIAVRMLTWADEPVDEAFWRRRIRQAIELRRGLHLDEQTDAWRVVHAEGDGLSGLIVERYADHLVFEIFSLGMFRLREKLAAILAEEVGTPASLDRPDRAGETWRVVMRADRRVESLEGFTMPPPEKADARVVIREHGIRYRVDVAEGHKTGFFCDQRENRRRFAALCRGGDVLDCCCYTGGFGLCARLLGDAASVTSVDLDEAAIGLARENANLNNTRIQFVHADAFSWLRQTRQNGRVFDAVVLDPPKLAMSRRDLEDAQRKYHDLNALAFAVVRPGGFMLTCSCSGLVGREMMVRTVHAAAQRAGRTIQLFDESGAAADHPVMVNCPESAYLKALWYRVL
jgi:23S rRNA (cytosine1962-C5)-methyltransferase